MISPSPTTFQTNLSLFPLLDPFYSAPYMWPLLEVILHYCPSLYSSIPITPIDLSINFMQVTINFGDQADFTKHHRFSPGRVTHHQTCPEVSSVGSPGISDPFLQRLSYVGKALVNSFLQ